MLRGTCALALILVLGACHIRRAGAAAASLLCRAARAGEARTLRRLLSRGADPNAPCGPDGGSALHAAAAADRAAEAAALLRAGADPFHIDSAGRTPLDAALQAGAAGAARVLVELETRLDPDRLGTALHAAAALGRLDLAALELSRGASTGRRDERGRAPLHLAAASSAADRLRARLLLERRGLRDVPGGAAGTGLVAMLLAAGADPDAPDGTGWSPIRLAAHRGRLDALRLMLRRSRRQGGWTALHTSALAGHACCVAALLEAGADAGAVEPGGRTALGLAREGLRRARARAERDRLGEVARLLSRTQAAPRPAAPARPSASGYARTP